LAAKKCGKKQTIGQSEEGAFKGGLPFLRWQPAIFSCAIVPRHSGIPHSHPGKFPAASELAAAASGCERTKWKKMAFKKSETRKIRS